jgi:hypothetical protein
MACAHALRRVQVLEQIKMRVQPLLYKVAMSGFLEYESSDALFEKNPVAIDVMIDVRTTPGDTISWAPPAAAGVCTSGLRFIEEWL